MGDCNQYYVHKGGNKCPYCHSKNIEGGKLEVDGPLAWCEIICNGCNRVWHDHYQLTGYSDVADSDGNTVSTPEHGDEPSDEEMLAGL
jgi:hypothetical protein